MKALFILPVILFAVLCANDKDESNECCPKKIVGGKTYIYTGKADKLETMQHKCSNPCLYTMEGGDNMKFCFKPGQLESKCSATLMTPGGVESAGGLYALPKK